MKKKFAMALMIASTIAVMMAQVRPVKRPNAVSRSSRPSSR